MPLPQVGMVFTVNTRYDLPISPKNYLSPHKHRFKLATYAQNVVMRRWLMKKDAVNATHAATLSVDLIKILMGYPVHFGQPLCNCL